MKRIDQILNDCVFDKKIKKDTATVSVSIAEAAMRRYAEQQIKKLEKKVILYENTREMPAYIRDQEQQIGKLEELIYKAIKDIDSAKYGEGYQFNLPFISAELKQALKK